VAETEKYAHVTYFFNGGVEAPFAGEDRLLVPSPKVATYDLQPEMSAAGVTDALVTAMASDKYDFIVANFANPDMVGHSGVWVATVRAVEFVDGCLGRIVAALPADGLLAITADHGNADEMRDDSGAAMTAHSLNPVPLVLVGRAAQGKRLDDGVLADVAPTLLALAGLQPLAGMTGRSLVEG
jgi:2,3-bisphosphoglycerate-independent phosphoglycerate mutase